MLNARSIIGNFSVALVAQGMNMAMGIVTSLLVPKVLGVEAFGYWQLFIFYISYVGFFHLGLNDGIYLVHGGESRERIDKGNIASQFWAGMVYQVLFAVLMVAVGFLFVDDGNRVFVIAMTGLFLLLNNAAGYWGYVLQCMDETRVFSASVAIQSVLFLIPLCALLLLQVEDFRAYVAFYAVAKVFSLGYCVYRTRDFLSSAKLPPRKAFAEAVGSIRVGIKLMVANIAGSLIVGVARFLIDANWGIETFSMVSFALSMVTFFMMFVSQASMVLFPALRKADGSESVRFFESSRDCLELLMPACYLLYFPAVWLLSLWLPDYAPSFAFFAYLLPMCIFDGKMNIVGTTFLKVLRKEAMLLAINLVTVAVSAAGVVVGVYVFHSVEASILAPVLALAARSIFAEWQVENIYGVVHSRVFVGSLVLAVAFVVSAVVLSGAIGFVAVVVAYAVFLLVFRSRMVAIARQLRGVAGGLRR